MIIYVDGVFDLYHRGHLESLKYLKSEEFKKKVKSEDIFLIVGIVSDSDAESYKRQPIICQEDRVEIMKYNKLVDKIIFPCPLSVNKNFITENNIDLVVHGFSNDEDFNNQYKFFEEIIKMNKFMKTTYYSKISTTDIIKKIKNL